MRDRVVAGLTTLTLLVTAFVGISAAVGSDVAGAAIEDTHCVVEPATSTGQQSGATAVAVGEQVRVGTEVHFEPGTLYQNALAQPDGTKYIASRLEVTPAPGSALTPDLATVGLTVDGTPQTLTPGTQPIPTGFVVDTTGPTIKVYFPADSTALLATPTGTGVPSYVVPGPDGQTFRLTYLATVGALAPGAVTPAVTCGGAISHGDANEAISERKASVAALGLDVRVAKSANLPVLAPSSTVTYTLHVSVPATNASGELRNGTAYDTVVTDTLPPGLDYVAGSATHGGVESGGVITWTIPQLDPGAAIDLQYQLQVPADAPLGATFANHVSATTTSLPGAVPGERTTDPVTDDLSLTNGAAAPTIDKTANVGVAGTGQTVTYTTKVTWPAGSTWHDVTLTDLLPNGMTLVNPSTSFTCAPAACPTTTALAPFVDTGGNTRFGVFVPDLGPFAADQTWTWTYTAKMNGVYADASAVPLGSALDNRADVSFDLIPRLGGVVPNPARLPVYDGTVSDVASVAFNRPVVAIDKAAPTSPIDVGPTGVTYTVTPTNTGGANATNVTFTDPGASSTIGALGTIQAASVTGATYNAGTGTFTVASVPAGGNATVTYKVIGSASSLTADADPYTNTATVTGYRDPANNLYSVTLPDAAQVTIVQPQLAVDKERLSPSPIAGTDGETIDYRITVTNSSTATAYGVAGTDAFSFAGTRTIGTCSGGMTLTAGGAIAVAQLAPGASASCDYSVELTDDAPVGNLDNTATVTWKNGLGQTGVWDDASHVVVPFTATDTATTAVVHPQLVLQKTPDADTPGNTIVNGQTSSYTITVTNVGPVAAPNVVVTDELPDGLTLDSAPTFAVLTPPGGTVDHSITGAAGDDEFHVDIPTLAPGASVQIVVPVHHDGVAPADDQLVNHATVTGDGLDAPLHDTGVLQWVPAVKLPTVEKSVDPAATGIGQTVTWTVKATVPENVVDLDDVAFVDTLPDGMTFGSYGTVTCDSGPLCPATPTPLTAATLPTGETRIGWFLGDVAQSGGSSDTSYTFTFTAQIAPAYSGTGDPPAGTSLTDTDLVNRIQPWFTLDTALDRYDDASRPDLAAANLLTQFERKGAPSSKSVHVETPKVTTTKKVTNRGPVFDWDTGTANGKGWTASAGDDVTYEVTFTNDGAATAYDVVASDSAGQMVSGQTMLRDVVVGALPAGVTVTDGWSLADPDVVFHIDQLAPGGSVTVTYTGTVAPSAELVPGFSGDNRDVALIDNRIGVDEFRSAPAGGGLAFTGTASAAAQVYVYTPSPYIAAASACVGDSTSDAGTTGTFSVVARNGAPPAGKFSGTLLTTGFPPDKTVGVGEDGTLTIVLSPQLRYVAGTAKSGATALPDPTSSVNSATNVQTLVFDLGDVPQGTSIPVAFDVRTTAFGVQGGMTATLTMHDAAGSPSRGTAVPGATYVYQHVQTRGCQPGKPLRITKFPDQDAEYTGQKTFKVGETITWTGGVGGGGAPYHDGEIVDTMPAGITYTPGTAVFTVQPGNVEVSSASGNLTETITPLPDGRTELRFTSPEFATFDSMTYSMQSVVADDAIVGSTLTNVINLYVSDVQSGSCADPTAAACDNGQARIISSLTPTVVKSVDHAVGPWGDTFSYTVDVTFPANAPMFDAFVVDKGSYPRALDGNDASTLYGGATIQCLSGCPGTDPAPSMLPAFRETGSSADEFARAWYLGDLSSQPTERVYRITYSQTFKDPTEYQAEFGTDAPGSQNETNNAAAGWNDTNQLADANYQTGGSQFTAAASQTFSTTPNRGTDDAVARLVRPQLAVDKSCVALPTTSSSENPGASTSTSLETTNPTPNFRCVLTAKNDADPATGGATVVDPVFTDTLPTESTSTQVNPSPAPPTSRPVTVQVISTTTSDPLLDVAVTEVASSPLAPKAASSLKVTGTGIELAPGESVSVTVDLRMTADAAFWAPTYPFKTETGVNTLKATSFKDVNGIAYTGSTTDTWNLQITKPRITVSERGFAPGQYDASLADPTACMAYAERVQDPPSSNRISVSGDVADFNQCSQLLHARGSYSLGGDYDRAYAGYGYGAPDVTPGTDHVTWAVDVAVQNPDSFPSVSVTDQIPYGFEYVPGSARLAEWQPGSGTAHTPLADPTVGANPAVTCAAVRNFSNTGPTAGGFFLGGTSEWGQAPWTPLTWTFANGGAGATGALWNDAFSYLNAANRDAAGALPNATPFDRMVRIVFDIRPRAEFADCLQTPQRANTFRTQAVATGTTSRGPATSTSLGWVVGVDLAHVEKTPDAGVSPDGTTATYGVDVTITDPTRVDVAGGTNVAPPTGSCTAPPPKPASPTRTPWIGLGDLSRNGPSPRSMFSSTTEDGLSTRLVVTDTVVDDGHYVPGSATFDMRDPWDRPFDGHLVSEDIVPVTVDGRQASRITWTFDSYPSPVDVGSPIGTFPCATQVSRYVTYPSSMHITVPLPIPDGTPDGTAYPNTASVTTDHVVGGSVVRSQSDSDTALVTVSNPAPPPPATKTAVPDQVAPGQTFDWVVQADLDPSKVWFDLGWTDAIPAGMEVVGYGTPTCVVTGTDTPCADPTVTPTTLTPVANGDGSTTVGWYVGDVTANGTSRTLRLPVTVRLVGDQVAGDQLTNSATGFSNEVDTVSTLDTPPDPATFAFTTPTSGTATVVEPHLEITKTVANGPGPFQGGDTVQYTVTVTNTGGAPAFDTPVSDTPAPTLTGVTSTSPLTSKGWTAQDPRLEWFIPTLAPGASVDLDVTGTVDPGYVTQGITQLTNTATVEHYTSLTSTDDHAREYPPVQASAVAPLIAQHLTIQKFAGEGCTAPAQVYAPDTPVTWCVVVDNTGDAPAHGVTVTDVLPVGWAYSTGSALLDGAPVEPTLTAAASGAQRLVWTLGDVVPAGHHVLLYSTVGNDDEALVTNRAVVDSTLPDGTPVPDGAPGFRAVATAQAAPLGAGLQIAKLPNTQRVRCDVDTGCDVTWQLSVLNADDLDLTNATVTDFLPAGLSYGSSSTPAGWSAASAAAEGSGPSGSTPVTWTHSGPLPVGAATTFDITAHVPVAVAERDFLNHAEADADEVPTVADQATATVFTPASVGDFVWNDLNADGRQDDGEPGVAGVTVELHDGTGALVATTVTDADGHYQFADLDPGTYSVRVVVPDSWLVSPDHVGAADGDSDIATDGTTATFDLSSGEDDPTVDAGVYFLFPVELKKTADVTNAQPGEVIHYTITVHNPNAAPYDAANPVQVFDNLDDVLLESTYQDDATATSGTVAFTDADDLPGLQWNGTLAGHATVTITYSVKVDLHPSADHNLYNWLISYQSNCVSENTDENCHVFVPVADLHISKTADPPDGTVVHPGQVVTYTLRFDNSGLGAATVDATDDLSAVLDDASITTAPTASNPALTVGPVADNRFAVTGTVPGLTTYTVTYQVTVNPDGDRGDSRLENAVFPSDGERPPTCAADDPTCTEHTVPEIRMTKTSDPADGSRVHAGDEINYTLSFENVGAATGAVDVTDDLTRVLDDATVTGAPVASSPDLAVTPVTGGSFRVTGTVPAGATYTVTYTAAVNLADARGDNSLDNFAVPTGTPPPVSCVADDTSCTTHPVGHLSITKAASTDERPAEGDTVTYTVTVTNDGGVDFPDAQPATATDDLSGVLDDATYNGDVAATVGHADVDVAGAQLTWTGPLAVGESATITYSVTYHATGDTFLRNTACVPEQGTDAHCDSVVLPLADVHVSKSVDPADGTTVVPGQVLTYTLTFDNEGEGPGDVDETEHLASVLDDATITSAPTASNDALTVSPVEGDAFTVTGTVPGHTTYTVTFAVTVGANGARGDNALDNFVTPTGTTPPAQCVADDVRCTHNPVEALQVTKTVSPGPSVEVHAGDTLTYTLTFTNVGAVPAAVDYTDDLSGVLDDGTVSVAPAASDPALQPSAITDDAFRITGSLAVEQTVTVTYQVVVKPFAEQGDHRLDNFLDPTGTVPPADCMPDDPLCTSTVVAGDTVSNPGGPAANPASSGGGRAGFLAFTGSDTLDLAALAAALLLAGLGLLLVTRRRRRRLGGT